MPTTRNNNFETRPNTNAVSTSEDEDDDEGVDFDIKFDSSSRVKGGYTKKMDFSTVVYEDFLPANILHTLKYDITTLNEVDSDDTNSGCPHGGDAYFGQWNQTFFLTCEEMLHPRCTIEKYVSEVFKYHTQKIIPGRDYVLSKSGAEFWYNKTKQDNDKGTYQVDGTTSSYSSPFMKSESENGGNAHEKKVNRWNEYDQNNMNASDSSFFTEHLENKRMRTEENEKARGEMNSNSSTEFTETTHHTPYSNGIFNITKDESLARMCNGLYVSPALSTITYLSNNGPATAVVGYRYNLDSKILDRESSAQDLVICYPVTGAHLVHDGRLLVGPALHLQSEVMQQVMSKPNNSVSSRTSRVQPAQSTKQSRHERNVQILSSKTIATNKHVGPQLTLHINVWLNHVPVKINRLPEEVMKGLSNIDFCLDWNSIVNSKPTVVKSVETDESNPNKYFSFSIQHMSDTVCLQVEQSQIENSRKKATGSHMKFLAIDVAGKETLLIRKHEKD